MRNSDLAQFHELAEYYDAINDWKDYREETQRLEKVVRGLGLRGSTRWLDVACGTGRHLEFLRAHHTVVGVDGSNEMLRIARRRLPGIELVRGDMRSFKLNRKFDVVSCLFSAIGHLRTVGDVRKTFANFAHHLNPGGVVIVEPWLDPSTFQRGSIHVRSHQSTGLSVVRLAFSSRRAKTSVIHYHFLVARPPHDARYFEHTSEGIMLSRAELQRLMREAGLRPRFLERGLMPGRGLLVGAKRGG